MARPPCRAISRRLARHRADGFSGSLTEARLLPAAELRRCAGLSRNTAIATTSSASISALVASLSYGRNKCRTIGCCRRWLGHSQDGPIFGDGMSMVTYF